MKPNLVERYFRETVIYGGRAVRRVDVERHLDYCGVSGPARLRYASLPVVPGDPEETFDAASGKWRTLARKEGTS